MSRKGKKGLKPNTDDSRIAIHKVHVIGDVITKVLSEIFKWGTLIYFIYAGSEVLKEFAGKSTYADVTFSWIMSERLASVLGLIFGAGGMLYGRRQARLRKDTVEKMHQFQVKYEESVNVNRTSSGLTCRGDTHEDDK